jgi:hypothetical protein
MPATAGELSTGEAFKAGTQEKTQQLLILFLKL